MKISEVSKMTGLTAKAIRLYEEKGLISVGRKNTYRDYGEEVINRLRFIRTLREMGISLSQICLHFNGVITIEELLNRRKKEMEKENIFRQESYNKCVDFIHKLNIDNEELSTGIGKANDTNALLGLDIGTTNISAVILDYDKKAVLETYTVSNDSEIECERDFAEFDAEKVLDKSKRIVEYLTRLYPNVKAIGVTGQMHGMVYLSDEGKAVSPFYNWQDGRGSRMFSESKTYCQEISDRTGYTCSSGYGFATMFYNHINHIEPPEAKSFCTIMDYMVMILTGNKSPMIHASNAASLGLYDVKSNSFDEAAVKKLGLSHYILPYVAEDTSVAGYYKNIPVSVAIGDNQASFFGSVKEEETSALVNFGTGSQISIVSDNFIKVGKEFEVRPYLFGNYLICGSALCGGKAYAVIEKFFSEYVKSVTQKCDSQYETMNEIAKNAYLHGQPLSVSTLFCGTRQDSSLRGSISQIDDTNFTPGNLILGVLQGMTNELKEYFDGMGNSDITHLVASGNAVKKNKVLQSLLKDTFEMELFLTSSNEEAAIGCALYAGVSSSLLDACQAKEYINGGTE